MGYCTDQKLGNDKPKLYLVGLVLDAMNDLGDLMSRGEDMSKDEILADIADIQANLQEVEEMCGDGLTEEYHQIMGGWDED